MDVARRQGMKTFTKWAVAFSVFWIGGVIAYVIFNWCKILSMEPNAHGDFLAGAFSPLAFFWLVAGYIQQGIELQSNTDALLAQETKLASQVAATNELALHAKQQAAASIELAELQKLNREERIANEALAYQPNFEFKSTGSYFDDNIEYRVLNKGDDAFDVEVVSNDYSSSDWDAPMDFAAGQQYTVIFAEPKDERNLKEFNVEVNYMDEKGFRFIQHYLIKNGRSTFKDIVPVS